MMSEHMKEILSLNPGILTYILKMVHNIVRAEIKGKQYFLK